MPKTRDFVGSEVSDRVKTSLTRRTEKTVLWQGLRLKNEPTLLVLAVSLDWVTHDAKDEEGGRG